MEKCLKWLSCNECCKIMKTGIHNGILSVIERCHFVILFRIVFYWNTAFIWRKTSYTQVWHWLLINCTALRVVNLSRVAIHSENLLERLCRKEKIDEDGYCSCWFSWHRIAIRFFNLLNQFSSWKLPTNIDTSLIPAFL